MFKNLELTVTVKPDEVTLAHYRRVEMMLRAMLERQREMAIDTSKLLAAAAQATTDNASLRALIVSTREALLKSNADLAAAIAAGDPAAIAQAQADIDTVTDKLNTDDAETKAALSANVQPAPGGAPNPAPDAA